ncbi:MAG: hypothetical protein K6A72_01005 [Lachnospiraceae bacterium]|nr:hypothetical protein [Lachnospiraceae bacterium]
MRNEKTTLGKIALIIAVVYILNVTIDTLATPFFVFSEYADIMLSNLPYGFLMMVTIVMRYFELAVALIWFVRFWRNSDAVRIPAVITLAYCVCQIGRQILNYLLMHTYESLWEVLRCNWTWFPIIAAWVFLVIGTKQPNRIIFSVIRGGLVVILTVINFRSLKLSVNGMLTADDVLTKFVQANMVASFILGCIIWVPFFIYIIKPKLLFKSE